MKKSLSIVAAGIIAAGLIGCGGGSSSSSSKTTSTTQPTEIKGVDGYVMNAKVDVKYWDPETNTTKTVNVDATPSYYYTVDISTNKAKAGKPEYKLDVNSSVLEHVVSVSLTSQTAGKAADGSVYAPSFFDADANGEYNSSIDVTIPPKITLKAPKGYSVVTPISTLIATAVEAQLNADKNETNLTAVIDDATEKVANALGINANTLKTVDPISLLDSSDEIEQAYVVANAFAGGIITENGDTTKAYNSLASAKKAASAVDVISNLQKAASASGATKTANILAELKNQVEASSENLKNIIETANLDKTRSLSIKNNGLTTIAKQAEPADFNITHIFGEAGPEGYKIQASKLNSVYLKLAANEQNITNKNFAFVIQIANPKDYVAADTNVSTLTVKVPFEVNATDGKIAATIPDDAKIIAEGINVAGDKILTYDKNLSEWNIKESEIFTVNKGTISINAKKLVEKIETNTSNAFFGGSTAAFPQKVEQIKAAFVVESANGVDHGNIIVPPKVTITSDAGTINETGIQLLSFKQADIRGNRTGKNKAPNNDLNISNSSDVKGYIALKDGTIIPQTWGLASATDENNKTILVNNNTALDINLTRSTVDDWEENTTVTWTLGDNLKDKNLSYITTHLKANSNNSYTATKAIDVNTSSTDDGNITTNITYKVCDEFGECNTTTAYLVVNRPWYDLNDTDLREYGVDANTSTEVNLTTLKVLDYDGFEANSSSADINFTTSPDLNWTNTNDVNVSIVSNVLRIELNGSNASGAEINLSFNYVSGDEWNLTMDANSTNWTIGSTGLDLNITGVKLQGKDKYGASKTFNGTYKFHLDAN